MDNKIKGKVNWNKSLVHILKRDATPVVTEQFSLSTDNSINILIAFAKEVVSILVA